MQRPYSKKRGLNLQSSAAALAFALATTSAVYAQEQTARFDIAAQPLSAAPLEYGRQAGLSVAAPSELVSGKTAPPVNGEMSARAALQQLLAGTELTFQFAGSDAVRVIARAGATAPEEQEAGQGPAEAASAEGDDREIVVTGSIILGAAPSGANLIVLGREDLDNTGRGTLGEAIQTMPQVHSGGANDATTRTPVGAAPNAFGSIGGGGFGTASLNLRGLGVEETLTLVNGRRLAPTGQYGAIADISVLPMAAVERVEILADGASATYGADAMAGVVNIIMNRRFQGAETRLRTGFETRSGQPEIQASQTFGWTFDRGNLILSADYARRDGITTKGRPYAASSDLRPLGGGDYRQNFCSPGNILFPADLGGSIPAGQDGRALTPDQIRRGEANLCASYPSPSYS